MASLKVVPPSSASPGVGLGTGCENDSMKPDSWRKNLVNHIAMTKYNEKGGKRIE